MCKKQQTMKINKKYLLGGFVLVLLLVVYGFRAKTKTVKPERELYAMREMQNPMYANLIPNKKEGKAIQFKINKTTTDAEFLKIMQELKKKDIDVMFNNVERNEDGIITNIEIVVSKDDLNKEFKDANPNGIQPILIKITDDTIFVGYEFQQDNGIFAFSNGNEQDEMTQIQKMMQRQMQMLQQLQGSSNNNDVFAKFFGSDMMGDPNKMMQQMMQQMMQNGNASFSNSNHSSTQRPQERTETKVEKHYIVNGKEMSEEEYKKMDKSKIRSLQVYQSQVISKSYGM